MTKRGFTLIELTLSIAFISVLAITVALIINDTVASYRRGLMLSKINTTGMDIADEIRASVQGSSPRAIVNECAAAYDTASTEGVNARADCEKDGAHNFVSVMRLATVNGTADTPVYGAFCTGNYTYIWNAGYFFDSSYTVAGATRATLRYKDADGNTRDYPSTGQKDIRLLKVKDETRSVCIAAVRAAGNGVENYWVKDMGHLAVNANINGSNNVFDISGSNYSRVFEEPEEILVSGENNLALYDLSVTTPAASHDNGALLYSVSFILGTVEGGISVKATGNYCGTPREYSSSFDYCAINKFNFAVRATGE